MSYILPVDVVSPKTSWSLVDVVLDNGPGKCAYAIGLWNQHRCIGFRWNGTAENPLGNPQSRGLPTWTILDDALYPAVLEQVEARNPEKTGIMRAFLGQRVAR